MSAKKMLVRLREFDSETWLLWAESKKHVVLRRYSNGFIEEFKPLEVEYAISLLKKAGNNSRVKKEYRTRPFEDIKYWFQETTCKPFTGEIADMGVVKEKLQTRFKREFFGCDADPDVAGDKKLRELFDTWKARFEFAKDKENNRFNHWCDETASKHFSDETGIGWTAQLLEKSRLRDGEGVYSGIQVENPHSTDYRRFWLLSMQLEITFSSKNNPTGSGQEDRIKPDGLGVCEKGHFVVFEVKGPQDESEIGGPILQATCGALGIYGKRDMIKRIARTPTPGSLRPPFPNADILEIGPSLGVHILTSNDKRKGPRETWNSSHTKLCERILRAFPELAFIAYSEVDPKKTREFTTVSVTRFIPQKRV